MSAQNKMEPFLALISRGLALIFSRMLEHLIVG